MENTILMTDSDRAKWNEPLLEYYINKGLSKDNAEKAINKVFGECQVGWNRAPRDLDTRIKMKSGFQWKSHSNLKPRRKEVKENEVVFTDEEFEGDYLFNSMSKSEKNWWDNRQQIYLADFDFNESSDKPLIEQLLFEELIQRRVFKKQLKYPENDYSKRLNDSLKRVGDIQTKLGITREQRAGILNKIDGNIAQIAADLDAKLAAMPEEMKKNYEEELHYTSLKAQKPPINVLPPLEKIEALLNIDGKISANLDSSRISSITEEVAKEITEQSSKDETVKPKEKELPMGDVL